MQAINPYALKETIKKKFGKISRFARIAKYDPTDLHKWLRGPFSEDDDERMNEIHFKACTLKDTEIKGFELTDAQRLKLRDHITKKGKRTIKEFCEKNPAFIQSWISKVLNGDIKKITKNVRALAKTLEVKI